MCCLLSLSMIGWKLLWFRDCFPFTSCLPGTQSRSNLSCGRYLKHLLSEASNKPREEMAVLSTDSSESSSVRTWAPHVGGQEWIQWHCCVTLFTFHFNSFVTHFSSVLWWKGSRIVPWTDSAPFLGVSEVYRETDFGLDILLMKKASELDIGARIPALALISCVTSHFLPLILSFLICSSIWSCVD